MQRHPSITLEVKTTAGIKGFPVPHLPCIIGSGESSDVRLKHPSVRTAHAMIRREGDSIVLAPVDAECAVTVDGSPGPRFTLADGVRLRIGDVPMRVRVASAIGTSAHAAPPPAPMPPPPMPRFQATPTTIAAAPTPGPAPAFAPPPHAMGQPVHAATPFTQYAPSGRMGNAWPVLIPIGLAAAFLAGGMYGWVNYYNPIVGIVTVMVAGGASFGVGSILSLAVAHLKIRNPMVALGIGAGSGLALMIFGWLSFLAVLAWARLDGSLVGSWFDFALSPIGSVRFATEVILPNGWFKVHSWTPTGLVLFAGWLIEAACFLAPAAFLAWTAAGKPFDESSGEWYSETTLPNAFTLPGLDPTTAKGFAPDRLESLVAVPATGPHLAIHVFEPRTAGSMPLVSVHRVKVEDKKPSETEIMEAHFVPPELVARLRAIAPIAAPPPSPPKA